MADLSAKQREKMPAKEFGLPEKARTKDDKKESGNYPMPDKAHARNAKARAAQQRKAGKLTKQAWCAITGLSFAAQLILIGSSPLGLIHLVFTIASLVYIADVRPALAEVTSRR